jgi:hypothetical protein
MRCRVVLALGCALALAGCGEEGTVKSSIYDKVVGRERESEPDPKAAEVALPAFPEAKNLIAFESSRAVSLKFYVDGTSISNPALDVVRFTLVGKGEGNAQNVSYEGFNCSSGDRITYAWGRSDGSWSRTRDATWTPIAKTDVVRVALFADYLCPGRRPVKTAAEGTAALRGGGHPEARSTTGGYRPDRNWQ